MGNSVLDLALGKMDPEPLKALHLGEIVMASPDLDPVLFDQSYRRLHERGSRARATVYAARNDWPLRISGWLNFGQRLGYIPRGGPRYFIADADLIDITGTNSDVFSLNHDTYANSPAIIRDLQRLLKSGIRPPNRRTEEMKSIELPAGRYWRYLPPMSKPPAGDDREKDKPALADQGTWKPDEWCSMQLKQWRAATGNHGAFALAQSGEFCGYSTNAPSKATARDRAMRFCSQQAINCKVIEGL